MSTIRIDGEAGAPGDAGDATLDLATAALREVAIPDGPSPLARERTLAALAAAEVGGAGRRGAWIRLPAWVPTVPTGMLRRVAAVVLLAAGVAAACVVVAGVAGHRGLLAWRSPNPAPAPSTSPGNGGENRPGRNEVVPVVYSPGARVTGEVRFDGDAPPPQLIDFKQNPTCAQQHPGPLYDDSVVVNLDDTLQNVVVSVVAGLPAGKTYAVPREPVYLDQTGCSYQPHVLAMRAGQKVLIRNSDHVVHNTHSLAMNNPSFNIAQPEVDAGSAVPSPDAPEFFQVRCDFHPWMRAWFCVFNHPYFSVSGPEGTFTLRDLPPGHYRLRAWHEKLGVQERDVVVKPGQEETVVNFVFHAARLDHGKSPGRAADDTNRPTEHSPLQPASLASAG